MALQTAVMKVCSGELSKKKASDLYGVPRKTITRHLDGKVKKPGSLGRHVPVLGEVFENALVEHAVNLQRMMFGLTTTDIRKLAFELAEAKKIQHPFREQRAGKGWLQGFMRRHPQLSVRSPEPTSLARAVGFNRPSVDRFFCIISGGIIERNVYSRSNMEHGRNWTNCCSCARSSYCQAWRKAGR